MIVTDPGMIRDILSDKSGKIGKARATSFGQLFVTGLLSYEGEKWVKHRRIVNAAFHLDKLKVFSSTNVILNKYTLTRTHQRV